MMREGKKEQGMGMGRMLVDVPREASERMVLRQAGWLGHSGRFYSLDEKPSQTERGGYGPVYINTGSWVDLGEGHWGIND